jgi:hypothetical protein
VVDDDEDALAHPLVRPLGAEIVEQQEIRVLYGVHPLVDIPARVVVSPAHVVQKLGHRDEERGHPLLGYDLVHDGYREVRLSHAYRATEVQTSPTLLIGFPAHDVVHDLGESLLRIPAKSGIEVVESVALHALAEAATVP